MILDARKTSAQRRSNASKIIKNPSASSEPWLCKEHHVEGISKSGKLISFYRNPCYKKNLLLKKKVVNISASYQITERFSLYGKVENVLDKDYVVITDYGTDPITAYLGVKFK